MCVMVIEIIGFVADNSQYILTSPDSSQNPLDFFSGDCNELLRQFGFQPRVREQRQQVHPIIRS